MGKAIIFTTPLVDQAPSYPHAYFQKQQGKPSVSVVANSASLFPRAVNQINQWLIDKGEPDPIITAAFMYKGALRFLKRTLKEAWVSYGVVIGEAKAEIGPMDILAKKDAAAVKEGDKVTIGDNSWKLLFYRLCVAYRMKKVRESPDYSYVSGMSSKLSNLGKSCVWKLAMPGNMDTLRCNRILEDPDLKKIFAAIDMFLTKFDDHEWSFIRAGTLISRYKQCMGLLDLFFADSAFYLPRGEILQWIFLDPIADQIVKMHETEDEIEIFSYLPYCVDLEIVGKSPFSATVNDAVHNWTHILGSLSGLDRSRKASVVGSPAPGLVWAAATAAYGIGKSTVLKQTFLRGNEEELEDLSSLTSDQAATLDILGRAPWRKMPEAGSHGPTLILLVRSFRSTSLSRCATSERIVRDRWRLSWPGTA